MAGNFKYLEFFILLLFCINCNNSATNKETVGQEIINQNFDRFMIHLPYFSFKDSPVIVYSDVSTKDNFFTDECAFCFDKINLEGFQINNNSKYIFFNIEVLPKYSNSHKIKLKKRNEVRAKEYISLEFSNFYIDTKINKAFIIVESEAHGPKGGSLDVYFFKKQNNSWLFYKKTNLAIM